MQYIIMCGGEYKVWNGMIRHMFEINGEEIVARTIRLLRENGVDNIAISSNNIAFVKYGLPLLRHKNEYVSYGFNKHEGKGALVRCFLSDRGVSVLYLRGCGFLAGSHQNYHPDRN